METDPDEVAETDPDGEAETDPDGEAETDPDGEAETDPGEDELLEREIIRAAKHREANTMSFTSSAIL